MDDNYKVLFRGLLPGGSVSAEGLHGDGSFHVSIPDRRLSPYLARVEDGGFVVDKWLLGLSNEAVALVFHGPLLDLKLAEGKEDRIDMAGGIFDGPGLLALGGEFRTLAAVKLTSEKAEQQGAQRWRGLDSVSLPEYLAIWRAAGARIGKRIGDKIVWEDGAEDTIPPENDRSPHPADACLSREF